MSYELALCTRIVRTGNIAPALNFGITIDDFSTVESKHFWNLIIGYYSQPESRGSVMSEHQVRAIIKDVDFRHDMPGETIEALCYQVRNGRIVREANHAAVALANEISRPLSNPTVLLAQAHKRLTDLMALGATANSDVSIKTGIEQVQYKLRLAREGLNHARLDWPWEPLQQATFGVQPSDYIIFYGRPKSMKTWVLCYLIAWAFEHEKRILVYTKEMTPENLYMRTLACILRMAYDDLREASAANGRPLQPEDEQRLNELTEVIVNNPALSNNLVVLSGQDVPAGGDTVPWLNSKVEQYKPDVMFVDGIYLLSDQRKATSDHTRVMNISRDLRALALSTKVPIIATMQANRKAAAHNDANLDEIAYSDALAQDATIAARVINDKNAPTISIVIGGSREFKLNGFRINGVPARDFSFHSELTEQDVQQARNNDQEAEPKAKSRGIRGSGRSPATPTDDTGISLDALSARIDNGLRVRP